MTKSVATLLFVMLVGCEDDAKTSVPTPAATDASAAEKGATSPADGAAPAEQAVCTRVERKVWGQRVNPRTGITPTRLGEGLAIGIAFGDRPHRLQFDAAGKGTMSRPQIADGHALAERVDPKEGVRHLQRVTVTGGAAAFADYRDKYESGRRRVACGPLGNQEPYLRYDGKPILEVDDSGREVVESLPEPREGDEGGGGGKEAPTPVKAKRARAELRDCRTFSNASGTEVWNVGSEVVSEQQAGKRRWKMQFFTVTDAGKGPRSIFHVVDLGESPDKLHTLEAPVAHELADGSFVVAGRYRGKMYAWLLGSDKKKKGNLQRYGGGYPGLPRVVADDENHLLLTSQKVDLSHWKLRGLKLPNPPKLAGDFLEPSVEQESAAEPTVARIGDQRWLAYHADDRRDGTIQLVPVDAELRPAGASFAVTEEGVSAYESHLFALGDELLIAYISRSGKNKPPELVTERLSCRVKQP